MSSPLSTSSSAFAWRPDVTAFAPVDAVPEALILSASTVAGEVNGDEPSLRVAFVSDDSADFFAEAAPIDESEPQLAECVVYTAKVAQLVALSNEQFAQEGTAEQISQSVSRAIVARADQAFIAQSAPIGPAVAPPAGLLSTAGIEEGGVVYDNLDSLVDLIATLESNGATPSHVILDPLGWAAVRKLKLASDSNASLVGCRDHRRRQDAAEPAGHREPARARVLRSRHRPQRRRECGRQRKHRRVRAREVQLRQRRGACNVAHRLERRAA